MTSVSADKALVGHLDSQAVEVTLRKERDSLRLGSGDREAIVLRQHLTQSGGLRPCSPAAP